MATVIGWDSFLHFDDVTALKAYSSGSLQDKQLALVENCGIDGTRGSLRLYIWDAAYSVAPLEPWSLQPDDIASGPGRWRSGNTIIGDEPATFNNKVTFASNDVINFNTNNATENAKLQFVTFTESVSGSGYGISGTAANGLDTDRVNIVADDVARVEVSVADTVITNTAKLDGDATYNAPHIPASRPIGGRRPNNISHAAGTLAFTPATYEETVIRCTAAGVTVNFSGVAAGEVGCWCQVLNSSAGNISLSMTGVSYNVYLGGDGLLTGSTTLTLGTGGVASIYYSATSTLEITGSGLS